MAMTAAAAAAFLGGVVDPSLLDSTGTGGGATGGGGGIMDSNFDDGMADDSGFEMANISSGHAENCTNMIEHAQDDEYGGARSGLHSRNPVYVNSKPITDFGVMLDTQRK